MMILKIPILLSKLEQYLEKLQLNKKLCELCFLNHPSLKRPKTSQKLCKDCFYYVFETEIHNTIISNSLFSRGDKIGICVSGGKDSTVLAYIMRTLNDKYDYGLDLYMIAIDEGISGYRDNALEIVKRIQIQYSIPLKILSYDEIYGWNMDKVVERVGKKNNCTFCGVFRRQALDRGAAMLNIDHIVTGHNADDIAETIIMNCSILRGDIARLVHKTSLKIKSTENHIIEILSSTLTYFFASLSDDLFEVALEKVIHFVSNNVIYQSIDAIGFLCNSCALRNPELFFRKLFPILKTNILFEIENNSDTSTRSTDNDIHPRDRTLLWNLQILSASINGSGNILMPYCENLTKILDILIEKSRGNLITHVGIFFSEILINFTTIYPIDRQIFGNNSKKYENIHPNNWAPKIDPKKINIQWHMPSEEEITFSQ
ncbi:hypothetical protein PCK2_000699 [Pneumocystis canis]|nr:hypothetical protein PCK2_000699 [Pneumocystis canis]